MSELFENMNEAFGKDLIEIDLKYRESGGSPSYLAAAGHLIDMVLEKNEKLGREWIEYFICKDRQKPSLFECPINTDPKETYRDIGFIIWNGYREYKSQTEKVAKIIEDMEKKNE